MSDSPMECSVPTILTLLNILSTSQKPQEGTGQGAHPIPTPEPGSSSLPLHPPGGWGRCPSAPWCWRGVRRVPGALVKVQIAGPAPGAWDSAFLTFPESHVLAHSRQLWRRPPGPPASCLCPLGSSLPHVIPAVLQLPSRPVTAGVTLTANQARWELPPSPPHT